MELMSGLTNPMPSAIRNIRFVRLTARDNVNRSAPDVRREWEFGHASFTILDLIGFGTLVASIHFRYSEGYDSIALASLSHSSHSATISLLGWNPEGNALNQLRIS
jgi:hypothetical protein